ncbi:hypothetical protein [Mycobacterium sp. 852002-51163_SCH5372311]|uniref:hypothetical protein n=1 Tax=Mycobacterium sp. 852002-51163_SCH5372311 TaxID=1834097 RepID=UPI000B12C3A4|nr:hypothetical protein [Mycobacterium sp. 852002-51163_SCH5372311]
MTSYRTAPVVVGHVSDASVWDPDSYLSGSFFGPDRLSVPQPRTRQLPLLNAIVNFS